MDFIELNKCEGKKYCLVIINAFFKWVDLLPLTAKPNALMVAKALTRAIISQFGIPEKIYCDNGTHFVNKVILHLVTVFGSNIKYHCSYHPQLTGLVERTNGTIKTKLRKAMAETGRSWVQCLPLVTLNMHMLPNPKGLSPYEIMYGRAYTIPEFGPMTPEGEDRNLAEYMVEMLKINVSCLSSLPLLSRLKLNSSRRSDLEIGYLSR